MAVIACVFGERPVISCTLGLWGYFWNPFMMCLWCADHTCRGVCSPPLQCAVGLVFRSLWSCSSQCCSEKPIICTPGCPEIKPIFIISSYHTGLAGKRRVCFFPVIPWTDKLVKGMCGIVLSMWVSMPEEDAVGRNSIFIHLIKGLASFSSHELQKLSCSFLLLLWIWH